jgi:hypothetical protein
MIRKRPLSRGSDYQRYIPCAALDVEVILAGMPEPYIAVAFAPSRISFPALK